MLVMITDPCTSIKSTFYDLDLGGGEQYLWRGGTVSLAGGNGIPGGGEQHLRTGYSEKTLFAPCRMNLSPRTLNAIQENMFAESFLVCTDD